ncbi:MAG: ribosome maturation factor RimP [Clostridia bacterium]
MAKNICELVEKLVAPIVDTQNLVLWNVEYVKEGSAYYLRVYIDKDGGADINDCENVSRALDAKLDEEDFIDDSYYLEVSSAGLERELLKPWHFETCIGKSVTIKLYKPQNGSKTIVGELVAFDETTVTIKTSEQEITLNKKDCATIRLTFVG